MASHLKREVFEPHLALGNARGPLRCELPQDAVIHTLGDKRVRYLLPSLHRVVRAIRPHLVVSTLGHLNLALLASKGLFPPGTRLLVREANTPSARLRQTRHPGLYRLGFRALYPRADRVLCNAVYMKSDLIRHVFLSPEKIAVVPNPVDAGRVRNWASAPLSVDRGKGVELVSVGRLIPQKGYDLLLLAMEAVRSRLPGLHLSLVGDGPERPRLVRLSRDLGLGDAVTFAGYQANPYPYMARADLFVSSSRYEGSPNVVLESLACGTPVLAFDCPGGTSEIIREGENGWLVPAEDVGTMAERLVRVIRARAWEALDADHLLPEAHELHHAVRAYEDVFLACLER